MSDTGGVDSVIDEIDLALLDGIHVNPRIGFDELGAVVGVSGVTAARRWRRMARAGQAWVSSATGPALPLPGALVEAECAPGSAQAVAERWAAIPHVFSVHITTGRHNLYGLVVAADQAMLASLIVDTMPRVDGVRAVQSSVVSRMFSGTHWRLGAISNSSAHAVAVAPAASSPKRFDDLDRRLYLALQADGRLSYRGLASRVGCSETLARRRLQALTRLGVLRFRADFARAEAGWPVNVVLTVAVPEPLSIPELGDALVQWPETRVVAEVVDAHAQLFVSVQVHELAALEEVVTRLGVAAPGVSVTGRRVVLRPVKSYGRLLGEDGRACGVVPVDPWTPPAS